MADAVAIQHGPHHEHQAAVGEPTNQELGSFASTNDKAVNYGPSNQEGGDEYELTNGDYEDLYDYIEDYGTQVRHCHAYD